MEDEINEMLVCEDKYEVYRLGWKRGVDRGYDRAKQQGERDLEVSSERMNYLSGKLREAAKNEHYMLVHIEQLKMANDELTDKVDRLTEEVIDAKLESVRK